MKTVKEKLMFAIVAVLLLFAAFYVSRLGKSIDRPGMECPKCGSPETLVIERTSDAVHCMCADCKTKFSITDAIEDADSAYNEWEEDSLSYEDTLEEEQDVKIRQ
jgi:hypothetical protein